MSNNSEILYDAFNRYFEKGIAAKEAGDIPLAKSQLLLAAEKLQKLAAESAGELKRTRQERVLKILEAVEALDGNRKEKSGGTVSRQRDDFSKKSDNGVRQEETETNWISAVIPDMNFDRVAGLDEVKQTARDMIIDPVIYPDLYKKHNLKSGGGILMYGLPGTGKTTIAKAIAGEVSGKFYNVKCSDIFSKWVGEAERNVRNLFAAARQAERAVIFFDDCDAIGGGRNDSGDTTSKKVLTELLVQMDGAESDNRNILFLAATNKPWDMDSALTRPGRFDSFLEIPLPDDEGREFLFRREFDGNDLDENVDIAEFVYYTNGYSGADIVGVCNYIKRLSLNRDKAARASGDDENSRVMPEDISVALKNVHSSIKKSDREQLERFRRDRGI